MARAKQLKIGILTGGGDCPGLNAAIRAVVCQAVNFGYRVDGYENGWEGVMKRKRRRLTIPSVAGIIRQGGTILHSSRTNPFKDEASERRFLRSLDQLGLEALIAIGGEDTLGVAGQLAHKGYPIIGIPKTIDNDVKGTDVTIGFDTAVTVATEAIDRLHTTAESHNRVIIVEVMGRHAGWIATYAGLAGGADVILIPERTVDTDKICRLLRQRHRKNIQYSIVVAAEGARLKEKGRGHLSLISEGRDEFGHVRLGGIGHNLAKIIEAKTGFETRAVVLGYLLRGGVPTAFDRVLATRFGLRAIDLVRRKRFGRLVTWQNGKVGDRPLSLVLKGIKTVDPQLVKAAEIFFG